ncbi:GlsB/YeaQ/YmgE family stress response membrane protein [Catellatospora vulcania]|uniref:GlsB/YeaQ/YmgE family stress response membrane protein n=1 Tax=Catellatospora vulcania TaxID=1460450 RepID=UPI0012D38605|nr:GlsB/YeaQ/YmgE family stress response membrane protein [Catellatospora vulcania]
MLILAILVWGFLVGWLAWLIVRGGSFRDVRWPQAVAAGLIGSFVGGLGASLLSGDGLALRPSGLIGSVLGAIVVLLIWGAVQGRRAR